MTKISVFGLGYIGIVSAACLAKQGHEVIGVDSNELKVDLINQGLSPIVEQDIPALLQEAVAGGKLRAMTDPATAVNDSELSLICVGTPSQPNGSVDLQYVRKVCQEIGLALRDKAGFHVVVCRSTVLPGTMRSMVIPTLEEYSGRKAGSDFGVCNNPEFLREGTAVYDFYHPPKTVIGETDSRSGELVASLYAGLSAPLIRTQIEIAEMVKYVDNVWHALKVSFANEIGSVCKGLGIDSYKVMEIFCLDTKLNLSPYYLKPGLAFGGSCLPKDVRAMTYKTRTMDLDLPLLNAILASNQRHLERAVRMIYDLGRRSVGILGLSFKAGTDDLRESPMVELAERLLGKGYQLCIYDPAVNLARLVGANRNYLLNHIPHISNLMVQSLDEVLAKSDVIVMGNKSEDFRLLADRLKPRQVIVDLVRIADKVTDGESYYGICW